MKSNRVIFSAQDIFALACGGCVTLIIILIMNRDYPFVGHDYRYFIPHLIDTNLYIRLNGLSIQWYTPSFGGGLPAFPNPQHIEYSIVQGLSFFINPWAAILLSTAGISLIGYYFFFKLLQQKLELDWMSSTLGAMFFLGNGFYIEHLIVGHLGYQLFPLSAVVLYALIDTRNPYLFNSALIAIVIALITHQAGFYFLIILILSLSMALPILFLYKPLMFNLKQITRTAITSMILSVTMIASKVYAIYAFMQHFPRQLFDAYDIGLLQGMIGLFAQLFGVMLLSPILILTRQNPEFLAGAFNNITGTSYGIWEIDTGLSPVLVIILFISLAGAIRSIRTNTKPNVTRSQGLSFILLMLAMWITAEMTLEKGSIFTFTKQLPFLRSLHVNVRFAAAFILPLTIVGAFQYHRYFLKNPRPWLFSVSVLITGLSLLSFFSFSNKVHSRDFSVIASSALHEEIQRGMTFPVTDITDTALAGWNGFAEHSSLYKPYEPIFGYELESFTPDIHPGKIRETSDGYFNMTNPVSLVFPEVNNLYPFERIKVSEREKLEIFLKRGQPEWNMPPTQKILNTLSLVTLIFNMGILFITAARIKTVIRSKSHN